MTHAQSGDHAQGLDGGAAPPAPGTVWTDVFSASLLEDTAIPGDGAYGFGGLTGRWSIINSASASTIECTAAGGFLDVHNNTANPDPSLILDLLGACTDAGHTFDPEANEYQLYGVWDPYNGPAKATGTLGSQFQWIFDGTSRVRHGSRPGGTVYLEMSGNDAAGDYIEQLGSGGGNDIGFSVKLNGPTMEIMHGDQSPSWGGDTTGMTSLDSDDFRVFDNTDGRPETQIAPWTWATSVTVSFFCAANNDSIRLKMVGLRYRSRRPT